MAGESDWLYVKACPKCRVPLLWMPETIEFLGLRMLGTGEKCRRCWRRKIEYLAVPSGCLHMWEERRVP